MLRHEFGPSYTRYIMMPHDTFMSCENSFAARGIKRFAESGGKPSCREVATTIGNWVGVKHAEALPRRIFKGFKVV